MAKHSITIDDSLYADLISFCKINGIKVGQFCADAIRKRLAIEKYGDVPFGVIVGEETSNENIKNNNKVKETHEFTLSTKNDDPFIPNEPLPLEIFEAPVENAQPLTKEEIVEQLVNGPHINDSAVETAEPIVPAKPKKRRL